MSLIVIFGKSIDSGADLSPSRNARIFVASKLVLCVSCAISARLSCMVLAIMRRRFGRRTSSNSCAFTAAGAEATLAIAAAAGAASSVARPPRRPSLASASTSRSMTRPYGPLGEACAGSTPSCSAALLARGETPSARAAVACGAGAAASAIAGLASCAAAGAAAAPFGANSANDSPGLPMTATFNKTGTSSSAL